MAYRGRYQLGQHLPIMVLARGSDETPGVPTDTPRATIYSPAGAVVMFFDLPVVDRYSQTGLFGMPLRLGADFATTGLYRAEYHYLIGSYYGIEEDGFEIVAGGNADGSVISMYYYDRPHAKFIVQELDSGKLRQGRNPTI